MSMEDETCDTENENKLPTSMLSTRARPNDDIFLVHGKAPDKRFTDMLR